MKYTVSIDLNAYAKFVVEANDEDEAHTKAIDELEEKQNLLPDWIGIADFGNIYIEDQEEN